MEVLTIRKQNVTKQLIEEVISRFTVYRPRNSTIFAARPFQASKFLKLGKNCTQKERISHLDVGTGWGLIPAIMATLGWDSFGFDDFKDVPDEKDLGSEEVRLLWEQLGCKIQTVSLTVGNQLPEYLTHFDNGYFYIISILDVLEHFNNSPKNILMQLWEKLAVGGFLYIEVPNHAMLKNRLKLLFGKTVHPSYDYYWDQFPWRGHSREYTIEDCRALSRFMPGSRIRELKTYHKFLHYSGYSKLLKAPYKLACALIPNSKDSISFTMEKVA